MFRGAVRIASVGFLVVWLFWMDVCLYYHIRTLKCNYNNDTNTVSHLYKAGSRLTFGPGTGTGNKDKTSITSGRLKPIYATINELPSLVSYHHHDDDKRARWLLGMFSFAFRGMSVKLIMSDPVDNYLMGPLADAFGDLCNFRVNFQFVSANMISFAGLLSALVAAKLVARQNSPTSHKLAFIFFQLRTWLDCLDGVVARSRLGITNHVSLQNTFGYLVDGVCDTLGFAAFIWGIYIYLKHWHFISYLQIPKQEESSRTETAPRPSHRRLLVLIALFSIQLALCAAGWNKYILEYNKLLGSPSTSHFEAESKLKILKSNIMFIIVWFWRLTNGHSWMQFLAISVLMGKIWHFLEFIKFIGLVEIIILVTVTQLHTIDVKNFLTI